jgi:hypothetical protein
MGKKLTKSAMRELRDTTYRDQTPEKRCANCLYYPEFGSACQLARPNNRNDRDELKYVSQNGICGVWEARTK